MKALPCAESAGSLVPAGEGDAVGDDGDGLGGGLTLDGLSGGGEGGGPVGPLVVNVCHTVVFPVIY
ncbi:hypothetical protein [Nonomuraea recticatena]|uniref:Uncharacterized protein n=1 Tax=Nonomuraea recticatena TaxID=46178 RepID=A0ABN3SNY2_9ACTN